MTIFTPHCNAHLKIICVLFSDLKIILKYLLHCMDGMYMKTVEQWRSDKSKRKANRCTNHSVIQQQLIICDITTFHCLFQELGTIESDYFSQQNTYVFPMIFFLIIYWTCPQFPFIVTCLHRHFNLWEGLT